MTYSDKLKNPKWQKKRLEIMQRDEFKCKICDCESDTLHVHHIDYSDNLAPWEYPENRLITLCENCHSDIHKNKCFMLPANCCILIADEGILSVYNFIQKYPLSLMRFSKIENHKGSWIIELNGNGYFADKLILLSNLAHFIGNLDNSITTSWDESLNFLYFIKPSENGRI